VAIGILARLQLSRNSFADRPDRVVFHNGKERTMNAEILLNRIVVPTPCPADWNQMRGDDRMRFCATCRKHVYNFAAMTSDEALGLLRAHGGDVCGRLYRRPDGTVITADCQAEPSRPSGKPWQFKLRTIMAVIAGLASAFGIVKMATVHVPADGVTVIRGAIVVPNEVLDPIQTAPIDPSRSCESER
jgi:hypothetical protein